MILERGLGGRSLVMFNTIKFFDSQDSERPIKTRFFWNTVNETNINFDIVMHQLELSDNIFSPFKSSENISYITLREKGEIQDLDIIDEEKKILISFTLSDDIVIEKRTRYTLWDLLGDVGGFNDGLVLVLQILTSAYSAVSFKTQFLASIYYDSNSDARSRLNGHQ